MATKPHHDAEKDAIIPFPPGEGEGFTFRPRAFNIVWGNDSRYWRIPSSRSQKNNNNNNNSNNNNGGEEAAELVQVSWLEVTGSVTLEEKSWYEISFEVSFKGDAFGWSECPVFLMAKVGKKGRYRWKRLRELETLPKQRTQVPKPDDPFVVEVTPQDELDTRLYFGLYEVWSGKWKGGLRVHNAIIKKIIK